MIEQKWKVSILKYVEFGKPFKTLGTLETSDKDFAIHFCETMEREFNIIAEIEPVNGVFTVEGVCNG